MFRTTARLITLATLLFALPALAANVSYGTDDSGRPTRTSKWTANGKKMIHVTTYNNATGKTSFHERLVLMRATPGKEKISSTFYGSPGFVSKTKIWFANGVRFAARKSISPDETTHDRIVFGPRRHYYKGGGYIGGQIIEMKQWLVNHGKSMLGVEKDLTAKTPASRFGGKNITRPEPLPQFE